MQQFLLLESTADIGRPHEDSPELRELVMAFGRSGCVALYRFGAADDVVYVLTFRHQKEAGYRRMSAVEPPRGSDVDI